MVSSVAYFGVSLLFSMICATSGIPLEEVLINILCKIDLLLLNAYWIEKCWKLYLLPQRKGITSFDLKSIYFENKNYQFS
jgi:hypothetical protein